MDHLEKILGWEIAFGDKKEKFLHREEAIKWANEVKAKTGVDYVLTDLNKDEDYLKSVIDKMVAKDVNIRADQYIEAMMQEREGNPKLMNEYLQRRADSRVKFPYPTKEEKKK